MSCHIVTKQEGRKLMRPISSREEYIKERAQEENKRQVNTVRMGFKEAKSRLVQMNYSCLPNDDGTLKGAKRVSKTFGMDVDFDENIANFESHLKELIDRVLTKKEETGLLMLERSATKGFHAVFVRDLSLTQEENLRRVSDILGVKFDEGAKDITRVFYTTTDDPEDLIYLDDRLFDNGEAEPMPMPTPESKLELNTGDSEEAPIQTMYNGIPLMEIATRWLENEGGLPKEGSRNRKLYKLAIDMRHICDLKPDVIASNIPHCGLTDKEVLTLCKSACEAKCGSEAPKRFQNFLNAIENEQEENSSQSNEASDSLNKSAAAASLPPLPPGFKEFVDIAPKGFKKPTIIALLPIWGTLCSKLRARYLDNRMHSPSFQTMVVGEQSSGKSFVRQLQDVLLQQIIDEDNEERAKFKEWQRLVQKSKNDKKQPEKPDGIIRLVSSSTSSSRLYEMMDNARGLHMITIAEEIDEITNNIGKECLTPVLRNAYDNTLCGRDYKTAEATSVMLKFYWNTLFCGTLESIQKFFKGNAQNGSVSRQMFIIIESEIDDEMPIWKILTKRAEEKIQKVVAKAMRLCRDDEGKVQPDREMDMKYLANAMKQWIADQRMKAIKGFSKSRKTYKNRAAVDGFRAGMVADWLYRENCPRMKPKEREKAVVALALFVADYCVENLITLFPLEETAVNEQIRKVTKVGQKELLDGLEDVFTNADISKIQKDYQVFCDVYTIIKIWKKAGLIEKIDTKHFKKIKTI